MKKASQDISIRIHISNSNQDWLVYGIDFSEFNEYDTTLFDENKKEICTVFRPIAFSEPFEMPNFTKNEFIRVFLFDIDKNYYAEVMCYANLEKYPCMKEQFEEMARQLVIEKNKK